MEKILLARVHSKLSAANVTTERILADHPEELCKSDLQDWSVIADKCTTIEELEENFDKWTARVLSYDKRKKGKLH